MWGHPRDGRVKRFLPFMDGQRSCAGLALANMNLTSTLALLYGRYTFRLADEVRRTSLGLLHGIYCEPRFMQVFQKGVCCAR